MKSSVYREACKHSNYGVSRWPANQHAMFTEESVAAIQAADALVIGLLWDRQMKRLQDAEGARQRKAESDKKYKAKRSAAKAKAVETAPGETKDEEEMEAALA